MTLNNHRIETGQALSPGLARGSAYIYRDILQRDHQRYAIEPHEVPQELGRIEVAITEVVQELEFAAKRIEQELDHTHADILHVQRAIVQDSKLLEEFQQELKDELVNAEEVVRRVLRRFQRKLSELPNQTERDQGDDVVDLTRRLLLGLSHQASHALESIPPGCILVTHRLLPSNTVMLSRKQVAAVVLEVGGTGSHAALLTREMGIPAVSGISGVVDRTPDNAEVLVDGYRGRIVCEPNDVEQKMFEQQCQSERVQRHRIRKRCREAVYWGDHQPVRVMANIGGREDAKLARKYGADGVGLCRLEQLYLAEKQPFSEHELMTRLKNILAPVSHLPITIRLLDAGGDKQMPFVTESPENDPFLGQRGVRWLMEYPDITRTQIGALLELNQRLQIRILIPMVTLVQDVTYIKHMVHELASERDLSIPPVGAMIETPAAALCCDAIAEVADFVSFGTNDLTQYTFAASRENERVDQYYQEDHPALWRLLAQAIEQVDHMPREICGELASRVDCIQHLLELGMYDFSVAPLMIPIVKDTVRQTNASTNPG